MPTECNICIETFNRTKRKWILCPYCPTDETASAYCLTCIKTYILQDDAPSPRCPSCRSGWTEDFMTQTFSKTWLLKEYKTHRERILLDLERARLPEAQEDAARYRRSQQILSAIRVQLEPLEQQLRELPERTVETDTMNAYNQAITRRMAAEREARQNGNMVLNQELRNVELQTWRTYMDARTRHNEAAKPILNQMRVLKTPEYTAALKVEREVGRQPGVGDDAPAAPRNQWSFVMKCPAAACEGFVGMNWKCGLCDTQFCKDCGEHEEEMNHICDTDLRATHQAMRKEAKPCPKCAAMISKIDGCDQMWCTQCQTAFSWRTGEIETSHVHNPHYFQWMRQHSAAYAPPRPVGDCLNLQPQELLDQVIHYANRRQQWLVVEWCRIMRHFRWVQRQHQFTLGLKQNDEWRRQLRVKRLVNEITDDMWKMRLQQGEKAAQKEFALLQVIDLFIQAGSDLLRTTLPDDVDIPAIMDELEALRNYCNTSMEHLKRRYNNAVEYIHDPRLTRTGYD